MVVDLFITYLRSIISVDCFERLNFGSTQNTKDRTWLGISGVYMCASLVRDRASLVYHEYTKAGVG